MSKKLYNCNRGCTFRIIDTKFPPDYPPELVEELKKRTFKLHKIDGMYSYCTDDKGEVHHPVAWSEVEILAEGKGLVPFD